MVWGSSRDVDRGDDEKADRLIGEYLVGISNSTSEASGDTKLESAESPGSGGSAFISCGMLFLTRSSLAGEMGFGANNGVALRADHRLQMEPPSGASRLVSTLKGGQPWRSMRPAS